MSIIKSNIQFQLENLPKFNLELVEVHTGFKALLHQLELVGCLASVEAQFYVWEEIDAEYDRLWDEADRLFWDGIDD